ncbi:MAG: hypothetical protein HYV16_03985 [Gammaproteobacteria bacterium]|nr:hypothetical protein [Gammaproteobacteria bacterium]
MSFDYGSQGLSVANPFRLEGFLGACRGAVLTLLGIALLLTVRDQLLAGGLKSAWVQLLGGLALLGVGLGALSIGLLRLFRFYVGRNIPADLAKAGNAKHATFYTQTQLKDMLMGRKNLTFEEPQSWLERLLLTLVNGFLYLPAPLRINLVRVFEAAMLSLTVVLSFGLALFSGSTGLTPITSTPVAGWLGWGIVAALLLIWWQRRPRHGWLRNHRIVHLGVGPLVRWLVATILAPAILVLVHKQAPLPAVPVTPMPWVVGLTVLALVALAYSLFMAFLRKPVVDPVTEVSEYRDQWQMSLHPMDIFRAFEMSMADHRYMEIPNREYEKYDPALLTDDVKGHFKGSVVAEVQPIPIVDARGPAFRGGLWLGQGLGQLLLLGAGLVLFLLVRGYAGLPVTTLVQQGMLGLLCLLFGGILMATAHAYAAEVSFESRLVHFFANGTFNRSKISTGMAITDSTRSENEIVRSALTPWIVSSRLVSSTFAVSGNDNLEQNRYILEMHKHDDFLASLVGDLRRFIDSRQLIAGVGSDGDLQAAGGIHQLNEVTRSPVGGQGQLSAPVAAGALPERRGGEMGEER